MINRLKYVAATLLIVIGCIHIGFSFFEYEVLSEEALWFVSGGLCFLFAGLFNFFLLGNRSVQFTRVAYLRLVNLLLVLFLVVMSIQLPMVPGIVELLSVIFLFVVNPPLTKSGNDSAFLDIV